MSKFPLYLILVILISASSLAIEILDPRDNTTVLRELNDKVTISINVPKDTTLCHYTHFKTPDTNVFFNCADNEFTTNVTYFGLHEIEVYTTTNGQTSYDTLTFYIEPINPQTIKETEAPLNLDTFVCLEGSKCVWDDQTFLEIGFLVSIVVLVILAYFGGKDNAQED